MYNICMFPITLRGWRTAGRDIKGLQNISTPVWRGWVSNFLSKKKWVFKTSCKWLYATHEEPLGRWELLGSAEFLTSAAVTESKTADGHHHRRSPWIRLERDHNLHHENTQLGDLRRARTVCRLGRKRSRASAPNVSTPVSPVRRRSLLVWFLSGAAGGTYGM